MSATLKLGFALVLSGFMLFSPIGCTDNVKAGAKPTHPCCPKPPSQIPSDCARPGCVYMEEKPMVVEAPANVDHELVAAPEIANIVEPPHDLPWGSAAESPSFARDHRYLTLHQLLL